MSLAADSLPNDVAELQEIVRQLVKDNAQKTSEITSQKHHILHLQEQLNLAIQKRFAAQSEKHSPDQLGLFNEAEALEQEEAAVEPPGEDAAEDIKVPAH